MNYTAKKLSFDELKFEDGSSSSSSSSSPNYSDYEYDNNNEDNDEYSDSYEHSQNSPGYIVDEEEDDEENEEEDNVSTVNQNKEFLLKIPQIIKDINSTDEKTLLSAVTAIRKALSIVNNAPIDLVIQYGFVPKLILLLHSPNPNIAEEACWSLTNIASGTAENCNYIIEYGVSQNLFMLLEGPDSKVAIQSTWCIGNIAGDSLTNRDKILEIGVLRPIINQLLNHKSLPVSHVQHCTWSLSNLFRGKPRPPQHYIRSIYKVLEIMIHYTASEDALIDTLWTLSHITDASNEAIEEIMQIPGLVSKVMEYIGFEYSLKILTPSLRVVGNFLTGDDTQTQRLLDLGVIPVLKILITKSSTEVIKESIWALSNITSGNQIQIQQVIDSNILPTIVAILLSPKVNRTIKTEATWALSNALVGSSKTQATYFVYTLDIVRVFCKAIHETDSAQMASLLVEGLSCVAKNGCIKGGDSDGPAAQSNNLFIKQFEEVSYMETVMEELEDRGYMDDSMHNLLSDTSFYLYGVTLLNTVH
ncbi:putative importin subunit alpha B [Tieghemostelium lacteum]|uniref:Importin subunit alpha n=1 Tax=Tieghemostelium lacteum TaxID=361077 RepID=A0A151Z7G0_TIELA|nr:putative importin subunit alpha B [Tieghemostelium lacteum]|eukprot:KYQ89899.1 putative importin subunit alpha B [Tieghemostelium lacteum]